MTANTCIPIQHTQCLDVDEILNTEVWLLAIHSNHMHIQYQPLKLTEIYILQGLKTASVECSDHRQPVKANTKDIGSSAITIVIQIVP